MHQIIAELITDFHFENDLPKDSLNLFRFHQLEDVALHTQQVPGKLKDWRFDLAMINKRL